MQKGNESMKNFKQAYKNFCAIETVKDLKKNKLTLVELDEVYRILMDIAEYGHSSTIMEGSKNWIERNGAEVREEGIGWTLT